MKNKFYVHDIPGRLRVKIPMLKGKTEMSDSVLGLFRNMAGVKNVSVNNVTGSVVFQYDPAVVRSNQILDTLSHHRLFDGTKVISDDQYIEHAATKAGGAIGKAVMGWALGKAFEGSGLGLLAVLI